LKSFSVTSLTNSLRVLQKDARFALTLAQKKPFNCLIQVTNRCNLKCSFCDFWPNPAPLSEELSVADYAKVSSELSALGTFLVSLEGGEPFVRKDLVDIVRTFSAAHITAVFTSGWFVTEENARALWDAGLTHISVSIDYVDAHAHDGKRGLAGTTDRAWRAVNILRDTAPRGGGQVNVMSVLMDSNWQQMEALFRKSAEHKVGHQVTLLSTEGTRRAKGSDVPPPLGITKHMTELFDRFTHVRFFREYFERMDAFLAQEPMPSCHAGTQGINIDHVGNVASCIERIGKPVGNVKRDSLQHIFEQLSHPNEQTEVRACQLCWTACRGLQQSMGGRGNLSAWKDLIQRTRT
jgi:MoaA/NifB/PqqE/SkfB family radical SAM enzyme